jgi:hypothetical protein
MGFVRRQIGVLIASAALIACSTARPCEEPNNPALALSHSSVWVLYPIRSLTFDGEHLRITSLCDPPKSWCAKVSKADAQALQ